MEEAYDRLRVCVDGLIRQLDPNATTVVPADRWDQLIDMFTRVIMRRALEKASGMLPPDGGGSPADGGGSPAA